MTACRARITWLTLSSLPHFHNLFGIRLLPSRRQSPQLSVYPVGSVQVLVGSTVLGTATLNAQARQLARQALLQREGILLRPSMPVDQNFIGSNRDVDIVGDGSANGDIGQSEPRHAQARRGQTAGRNNKGWSFHIPAAAECTISFRNPWRVAASPFGMIRWRHSTSLEYRRAQ
jgi:hypothetical protein